MIFLVVERNIVSNSIFHYYYYFFFFFVDSNKDCKITCLVSSVLSEQLLKKREYLRLIKDSCRFINDLEFQHTRYLGMLIFK
jgi:hypothetical protein